ncbi:polyprenyl synthetase family protein [Desulfocurvus vexinensis]|uniref:polyprenyl synthetase family protein n=1 Tax=Desulfocurvus vexinensis TaxID=399548 RepID=UPI00048B3714|nr:polyprenyl synthetase family protein [Desulfocurvus vexinensis]
MNSIARYLQDELPRINAFLDAQTARLDPVVRPAAQHVLGAGGKRLRPLLALATARALGCAADPYPLACSLELLHSATLLHDDILDAAAMRRGRAAAHLEFGRTGTILAGDVLLALANRLVADYDIPRLNAVLAEAILRTVTGEIMEIASVRDTAMSQERYYEIITGKTAYLFQGACQCGAILAGCGEAAEQAAHDYGLNLGIAFQLVDDALDYVSPLEVTGKPSGGDLREGKMTLPLILYLRTLPPAGRQELEDRFTRGELDADAARQIADQVATSGCAEATRDAARGYAALAAQALETFPPGPERELLADILDLVLSRNK